MQAIDSTLNGNRYSRTFAGDFLLNGNYNLRNSKHSNYVCKYYEKYEHKRREPSFHRKRINGSTSNLILSCTGNNLKRNSYVYEGPPSYKSIPYTENSGCLNAHGRRNSTVSTHNSSENSLLGRISVQNRPQKNSSNFRVDISRDNYSKRSLNDLTSLQQNVLISRHSQIKNKRNLLPEYVSCSLSPNYSDFDQDKQKRRTTKNSQLLALKSKYGEVISKSDESTFALDAGSLDLKKNNLKIIEHEGYKSNGMDTLDLTHSKLHLSRRKSEVGANGNDRLSTQIKLTKSYENAIPSVLSGNIAADLYNTQLTTYELNEIREYSEVYYLGLEAEKRYPSGTTINDLKNERNLYFINKNLSSLSNRIGFDDKQSSYILVSKDHLAYRYEIIEALGKGSFGHVVHAKDHCTGQFVAVKIVKSEARFTRQAAEEIRILKALNSQQRNGEYNVVKLLDHFLFRGHVCMVFELLYLDLYELICQNNFKGLSQSLVRKLGYGILCCLELLFRNQIIHCDLKPENILLRRPGKSQIKVIDFGSSCQVNQRPYTYIQSRFYRAPEVILGMSYGTPIDMWSLGCILAEFITGEPLFPGEDAPDQLACIMEILGLPPSHMINEGSQSHLHFTSSGQPLYMLGRKYQQKSKSFNNEQTKYDLPNENLNRDSDFNSENNQPYLQTNLKRKSSKHKIREPPGSRDLVVALTSSARSSVCLPVSNDYPNNTNKKLPQNLNSDFLDFLQKCLKWDPSERMNPIEALQHPWILNMQTDLKLERKLSFKYSAPNSQQNSLENKSLYYRNNDPMTGSLANILGVRTRGNSKKLSSARRSEVLSPTQTNELDLMRRYSLSNLFDKIQLDTNFSNNYNLKEIQDPNKIKGIQSEFKQYRQFLNNKNLENFNDSTICTQKIKSNSHDKNSDQKNNIRIVINEDEDVESSNFKQENKFKTNNQNHDNNNNHDNQNKLFHNGFTNHSYTSKSNNSNGRKIIYFDNEQNSLTNKLDLNKNNHSITTSSTNHNNNHNNDYIIIRSNSINQHQHQYHHHPHNHHQTISTEYDY